MVQNHLFQLLSLIAMEPPISFEADAVRDEKVKVAASDPADRARSSVLQRAVRGQYGAGPRRAASRCRATATSPRSTPSRDDRDLRRDASCRSTTGAGPACRSTCAPASACRERVTEIAIQFKQRAAHRSSATRRSSGCRRNLLVIRIQPDEGISLRFGAKVPGPTVSARRGATWTSTTTTTSARTPSTGYETLLYDVMIGDATLFQRADMVEAGWAAGATRPRRLERAAARAASRTTRPAPGARRGRRTAGARRTQVAGAVTAARLSA